MVQPQTEIPAARCSFHIFPQQFQVLGNIVILVDFHETWVKQVQT
jgi:hypothetical protein